MTQGQAVTRFTIRDLPMINRHAVKRWGGLSEDVKREVCVLIHGVLASPEATIKEKIAASNLAVKIDSLNLKHEIAFTPKVDMDVTQLSEEELDAQIQALEAVTSQIEVMSQLMGNNPEESIGTLLPMPEAMPEPELLPHYNFVRGSRAAHCHNQNRDWEVA